MGKKHVMLPVEEVDFDAVKYERLEIKAPHLTGLAFKVFVSLIEAPFIGWLIRSHIKNQNKITEKLRKTVIPERPMFKPEFPPQDPEPGVVLMEDDSTAVVRVESALKCLPPYDPSRLSGAASPFLYWKIRDFAQAYRSRKLTPSMVAEHVISGLEEFSSKNPSMPLLIAFSAEEVRKQAAASTQRFQEGKFLSILDGIFVAVKDDIDCYPYTTNGATTWFHEVREVTKDAVCVSRLRSCGVILVGKANMHEMGIGTTGNNPNYGTTRNPHDLERYTGGSSSGPAAIVAAGLCSVALGTDGGGCPTGSIRIPSSLCGVVGLKTTYGRVDTKGSLHAGTVEIIGPITATVEDVILVYAAISGSSPSDRISLNPPPTCLPDLSLYQSSNPLRSFRLGKYTEWFNDVSSTDISDRCEDVLNLLSKNHGYEMIEIIIPELPEMRIAHLASIGSEFMCALSPYCQEGKGARCTHDTRTNLALFQSLSASDYVAAQRLRRRIMYYHMEIFKKVDFIVTPTTGMTAPKIPTSSLKLGETNLQVAGHLMQFIVAGNLLGLPAISVPVGHDKQGLPIGLQLIGRPWGEASVLHLASLIETVKGVAEATSVFETSLDEGLLVHISYSPRKLTCRNCMLGSNFTSTSDFKIARVLGSLQTFRCLYNFKLRLPVFHDSKGNTLRDTLNNAISSHAKELKLARAIVNGNLVAEDQLCTSDGLHEVELLLPFMKDSPAEACSEKEVVGILVFGGSVCSFAYLNPKESISQAVAHIKILQDHCKELMFMEPPADKSKLLEPETGSITLTTKSFWDALVSSYSTSGSIPNSVTKSEKNVIQKQSSTKFVQSSSFSIVAAITVLVVAIMTGLVFFMLSQKK